MAMKTTTKGRKDEITKIELSNTEKIKKLKKRYSKLKDIHVGLSTVKYPLIERE